MVVVVILPACCWHRVDMLPAWFRRKRDGGRWPVSAFRAVGAAAAKLPVRTGGEQESQRIQPPVRRSCVDRGAWKARAPDRPPCASSEIPPAAMDMVGAGRRRRRIRGFRLCTGGVPRDLSGLVLGGRGDPAPGRYGGRRAADRCCLASRLVGPGAGTDPCRASGATHTSRRARRGPRRAAAAGTAASGAGNGQRQSVRREQVLRRSRQRGRGRGRPAA